MPTKEVPSWIVALVTALIVGGAVYFFTSAKQPATAVSTEVVPTPVADTSKSSKEYASMGREMWSAFSCSSLASVYADVKEQERLFLFGYSQGQKFLTAIEANKITSDDFRNEVPVAVSLSLQGPTSEFIIGQIYAFAQDSALDEVYTTNGDFNSKEAQEIIAQSKFTSSNCGLIGK